MSVYVDSLNSWGWKLRGHTVQSCHMVADTLDELHAAAAAIGMRREWYQPRSSPHYDLTASRRRAAVANGAIELGRKDFVKKMRALRRRVQDEGAGPQSRSRNETRRTDKPSARTPQHGASPRSHGPGPSSPREVVSDVRTGQDDRGRGPHERAGTVDR